MLGMKLKFPPSFFCEDEETFENEVGILLRAIHDSLVYKRQELLGLPTEAERVRDEMHALGLFDE